MKCPFCGAYPLQVQPPVDTVVEGHAQCPSEHLLTIHRGVLAALPESTPGIVGQLEESARERRGDLTEDEKATYRRYLGRIGARTYNQLIRENARAVLDRLAVRRGMSLDVGGGSGWLAAESARQGLIAISLDIEDPWERSAQIAAGAATRDFELVTDLATDVEMSSVDFVVGDMNRLPFVDASFDLVTISAALHHSEDPVATLREVARLVRPGGLVLCMNEPVKGLFRDARPILHGRSEQAGDHIYSAGEYLRFFRASGLEPRLNFPGWIDRRLRERDWDGVMYYKPLLPIAGALWRISALRAALRGPLLRPAMDLFGLTLIVDARKPRKGEGE